MLYIYLDYKCPHCGEINHSIPAEQTTGPAYLQHGTGEDANYGNKSVQFSCVHCQTTASYEVRLSPL